MLRHRTVARNRLAEGIPACACEDCEAHSVGEPARRGLGRVEVRVRIEPDDPEVGAEPCHDSERAKAVPGEHERKGPSRYGARNVLRHQAGGREQGGDLVRLTIEADALDLDLVTVGPQHALCTRVEEPVRPRPHAH
jgi:hypothetical protein